MRQGVYVLKACSGKILKERMIRQYAKNAGLPAFFLFRPGGALGIGFSAAASAKAAQIANLIVHRSHLSRASGMYSAQ